MYQKTVQASYCPIFFWFYDCIIEITEGLGSRSRIYPVLYIWLCRTAGPEQWKCPAGSKQFVCSSDKIICGVKTVANIRLLALRWQSLVQLNSQKKWIRDLELPQQFKRKFVYDISFRVTKDSLPHWQHNTKSHKILSTVFNSNSYSHEGRQQTWRY